MVFVIVSGLIAWTTIEKKYNPSSSSPLVQVSLMGGAHRQKIEQQVVRQVEAAVKNIDNCVAMLGLPCDFGSVRLKRSRADLMVEDVRDALDGVTSFPRDLEPPRIRTIEWTETIHYLTIRGDVGERLGGWPKS